MQSVHTLCGSRSFSTRTNPSRSKKTIHIRQRKDLLQAPVPSPRPPHAPPTVCRSLAPSCSDRPPCCESRPGPATKAPAPRNRGIFPFLSSNTRNSLRPFVNIFQRAKQHPMPLRIKRNEIVNRVRILHAGLAHLAFNLLCHYRSSIRRLLFLRFHHAPESGRPPAP